MVQQIHIQQQSHHQAMDHLQVLRQAHMQQQFHHQVTDLRQGHPHLAILMDHRQVPVIQGIHQASEDRLALEVLFKVLEVTVDILRQVVSIHRSTVLHHQHLPLYTVIQTAIIHTVSKEKQQLQRRKLVSTTKNSQTELDRVNEVKITTVFL